MALKTSRRQNKTSKKTKSALKARPKINKWLSLAIVIACASVGAYLLFFAKAAVAGCSQVPGAADGKQICNVTQASTGQDSVISNSSETDGLVAGGWWNWGTVFRAPNYAKNGALPVHRFLYPDISAHLALIEGSKDYNVAIADPGHYHDEGIVFFAWPDGREPGTVPIERIDRGALYFLSLYFDNRQQPDSIIAGDHSYSYHDGINGASYFYAYPANYVVPLPPSTPPKDTNCANVNLVPGDKGDCVKTLKHFLNADTNGATALNEADNNFDGNTSNAVRFVSTNLKNAGVPGVDTYNNLVTVGIWNAIAGITKAPAAPATPPNVATVDCSVYANFVTAACKTARDALTKKASTPAKTSSTVKPKTSLGSLPTSGSSTYSKICPTLAAEFAQSNGKGSDGKPLSPECIKSWQSTAGIPPAQQDGVWGKQTAVASFVLAVTNANIPQSVKTAITNPGSGGPNNHSWTAVAQATKSLSSIKNSRDLLKDISLANRVRGAYCVINIYNNAGDSQLYWHFKAWASKEENLNPCLVDYETGCDAITAFFLGNGGVFGCDLQHTRAKPKTLYFKIADVTAIAAKSQKGVNTPNVNALKAPAPDGTVAASFK